MGELRGALDDLSPETSEPHQLASDLYYEPEIALNACERILRAIALDLASHVQHNVAAIGKDLRRTVVFLAPVLAQHFSQSPNVAYSGTFALLRVMHYAAIRLTINSTHEIARLVQVFATTGVFVTISQAFLRENDRPVARPTTDNVVSNRARPKYTPELQGIAADAFAKLLALVSVVAADAEKEPALVSVMSGDYCCGVAIADLTDSLIVCCGTGGLRLRSLSASTDSNGPEPGQGGTLAELLGEIGAEDVPALLSAMTSCAKALFEIAQMALASLHPRSRSQALAFRACMALPPAARSVMNVPELLQAYCTDQNTIDEIANTGRETICKILQCLIAMVKAAYDDDSVPQESASRLVDADVHRTLCEILDKSMGQTEIEMMCFATILQIPTSSGFRLRRRSRYQIAIDSGNPTGRPERSTPNHLMAAAQEVTRATYIASVLKKCLDKYKDGEPARTIQVFHVISHVGVGEYGMQTFLKEKDVLRSCIECIMDEGMEAADLVEAACSATLGICRGHLENSKYLADDESFLRRVVVLLRHATRENAERLLLLLCQIVALVFTARKGSGKLVERNQKSMFANAMVTIFKQRPDVSPSVLSEAAYAIRALCTRDGRLIDVLVRQSFPAKLHSMLECDYRNPSVLNSAASCALEMMKGLPSAVTYFALAGTARILTVALDYHVRSTPESNIVVLAVLDTLHFILCRSDLVMRLEDGKSESMRRLVDVLSLAIADNKAPNICYMVLESIAAGIRCTDQSKLYFIELCGIDVIFDAWTAHIDSERFVAVCISVLLEILKSDVADPAIFRDPRMRTLLPGTAQAHQASDPVQAIVLRYCRELCIRYEQMRRDDAIMNAIAYALSATAHAFHTADSQTPTLQLCLQAAETVHALAVPITMRPETFASVNARELMIDILDTYPFPDSLTKTAAWAIFKLDFAKHARNG